METKSLVALAIDNGLFSDFCLTIAPAFKQFLYWTPWQSAFPKSNQLLPGDGFDEMERVKYLWDAIEKADLIIFPDVYYGDLQEKLVRDGKMVWGSRRGEVLELNRMKSKRLLKEYDIQPSKAIAVHGLENLRAYLKEHENVFVKISANRGDFETFESKRYELSEPKLDQLEHQLGAKKLIAEFVVEESINPAQEWGIDAFTIDGQWPVRTFCGFESKDVAFVGRVMEWEKIPQYLRDPNEKLSPLFAQVGYRGFFSTELRITPERDTFLIDPCCRLPSPPNEIQQMIFDNWADIIASGANGTMVDPSTVHKYGVCAMIHSSFADQNWQSLKFPENVRPFVKLRNHCKIDAVDYVVPQSVGLPEVGAVIGLGDTLEEAMDHLKENADQVEGYYLDIKTEGLDSMMETVEAGKTLGIEL
jgi:hypothetical protein